jgi:large subunit ribosomal protein L19
LPISNCQLPILTQPATNASKLAIGNRKSEMELIMNRLDTVEQTQLRNNIPDFQPGDTVRVHVRIKESETKERLQAFEGICIARKHGGARETITVRKTSFGVGVERIFPLHATIIDHIDLVKKGHVRRAKLYYLRELRGKAARIRERDTRQIAELADTAVVAHDGDGDTGENAE